MSATWPYVLGFARAMEAKLEENRHKGDRGWQRDHGARALFVRLQDESKELGLAIDRPVERRSSDEIRNEAADVANFAMMIADVAGGFEPAGDAMTAPAVGALTKCLVCALDKPWGIFSCRTGETVCVDCRDKARGIDWRAALDKHAADWSAERLELLCALAAIEIAAAKAIGAVASESFITELRTRVAQAVNP